MEAKGRKFDCTLKSVKWRLHAYLSYVKDVYGKAFVQTNLEMGKTDCKDKELLQGLYKDLHVMDGELDGMMKLVNKINFDNCDWVMKKLGEQLRSTARTDMIEAAAREHMRTDEGPGAKKLLDAVGLCSDRMWAIRKYAIKGFRGAHEVKGNPTARNEEDYAYNIALENW